VTVCALVAALAAIPSLASETVTREAALQPGGEIVIDASSAHIEVNGEPGASTARIEVRGREGWQKDFELEIEESPSRVTVRLERRRGSSGGGFWGWLFDSAGYAVELKATVPEETGVVADTSGGDVSARGLSGNVSLDTSGGDVTARDVRGRVIVDTSGGDVRIEDIEGPAEGDTSGGDVMLHRITGEARADTSGGDIVASRIGGRLVADTSGGDIEVEEIGGEVEASTSGGSIRARLAEGNAAGGSLGTSGGNVTVMLDPGLGLEIEATARSGRVICEVPIDAFDDDEDHLHGRVAGGGPRLSLRTSGGTIRIQPLD
jgi:hypothetical protein